jgi:hypothetical protein
MTSKAWLAEVDARPDYDYSTKRVTWLGACAVVLVDQEVVCSPVVLRDLDSVDTLWEAPGKTGMFTNFCNECGCSRQRFSFFLLAPFGVFRKYI